MNFSIFGLKQTFVLLEQFESVYHFLANLLLIREHLLATREAFFYTLSQFDDFSPHDRGYRAHACANHNHAEHAINAA